MKLKLFICVAFAAAVAWFLPRSPVDPAHAGDRAYADISARMRPLGLNVVGQPSRQGSIYVVNALDPRGTEMRVIMDAQDGSLVSIGPSPVAPSYGYSQHYDASPRIINIAPVDDEDFAEPAPRRQNFNRAEPRRAPIRQIEPRAEPRPVEPRRAVRQIVPPRELPRADIAPAVQTGEASVADPQRDEMLRSLEQERRITAPPPPRTRPRTVLAPPPYADIGPTPVRPLHRRDSGKFAPPNDGPDADSVTLSAPEDALRSEARASVPQALPQIPAPPRAIGMPVPPPQAEQKPAEPEPENPEDSPPPGNAVGDFARPAGAQ